MGVHVDTPLIVTPLVTEFSAMSQSTIITPNSD